MRQIGRDLADFLHHILLMFCNPIIVYNFIWSAWRTRCCDHRWIAGCMVHQNLLAWRICGRGLLPGCKNIHRIFILWCLFPNVRSNPIGEKCLQACAAIAWGYRQNPYRKIYPGYQISLVNGFEEKGSIISELQTAEALQMTFIVMSTVSKLDDMFDESARRYPYAHTIAAAIRKTQARILARAVELHEDIVDDLVQKWGTATVDVHAALHESCNNRGLHFSILNDQSAAEELSRRQGRDLLASFSFSASAWKRFSWFLCGTSSLCDAS